VITSKEEASSITFPNVVVASDPEMTVNKAIRILRNGDLRGYAVIGIDPGEEPGIAVVSNGIVEAVYRVPLGQAVGVIERIKQTYSDILVRIGHGARLASVRLANSIVAQGIPVELVNESGTSPYLGKGTGGAAISDIVAAINIAYTQGVRVGHQEILPSKGEIRWTISRPLAKRVAIGEITINEALIEHKHKKQN
jgi:CBS domain-containing protein